MFFAGTDGWIEITAGEFATRVTGAKLAIGSYGTFDLTSGRTIKSGLTKRMV
jgi:hypothetical protein